MTRTSTTRSTRSTRSTALRNRQIAQAIREAEPEIASLGFTETFCGASARIVVRKREQHPYLGYQGGILGRYVVECVPSRIVIPRPVISFASAAEANEFAAKHLAS